MRKNLDTNVCRPAFEALEPRLLLAADPVGIGLEGTVGLSALDAVTIEAGESYDPQDARGSRLLSFVDSQHGWMVGSGSSVYYTNDAGVTWQEQSVGMVYSETFEAQTAGINNFPTPNAAPAPFWVAGSQNYWGGGGIWGAPFVAEAVHANPGKMYMVKLDIDANTAYDNWGASSAWQFVAGADAHPEEMILEFDMFVREYGGGLGPRISLVDADSGFYRTVGIKWSLGASGISIYDPSGGNDVFVAASLSEQWQHYELIVNTNTQTVSLSVDSATPVVTTYTPNTGGTFDGTPDAVEIYGAEKYLDWYALDNFRLEVNPESATSTSDLNAVYFVDSQSGWAVGDAGTILKTTNGGQTWSVYTIPSQADLLDVFFYDASNGWAVGDNATFAKTTNGGASWQVSQIDPSYETLTGVSFHENTSGNPIYGLAVGASGGIFRTTNNGSTWQVRRFPTATPLHAVAAVTELDWSSSDFNNYAVGPGGMFVSCWYKDYIPSVLQGQPDLKALDFLDDQVGWVVGEAGIIRETNDAGMNWDVHDVRPFDLQAVEVLDDNLHVWALSEWIPSEGGRILFSSTDGGATWDETLVPSGAASGGISPDVPATGADSAFRVFIPEEDAVSDTFILPDRAVLTSESSDQMIMSAAAGEYEPATFAIRSSVALTNVHVQAADLYKVGAPGTVISADAVDIKWVKRWYQNHSYTYTPDNVLTPELLLNNDALVSVGSTSTLPDMDTLGLTDSATLQPLDLAAAFTKQVWLTVHVPDGAAAGEYIGEITVTADGQPTRTLELRVTVLPFVLEEPMLEYAMYVNSEMDRPDGRLYGRMWTRTYEQVEALMADLKAHGVMYPFLQQPITLVPTATPPGDWTLVQYDSTLLDDYLEILDNLGFPKDKLYWGNSYMMRYINYSKSEPVGSVAKWPKEAFIPTLDIVADLAYDFGYAEVYFQGMDEVSGSQMAYQQAFFDMIRAADTAVPGMGFGAASTPSNVYDATHVSQFPSAADIAAYQASGREVTIYANPTGGREQAYTYRRNVGLLLYELGLDGTGWWADYQTQLPTYDNTFVYYTADAQLDTLQWEGWREGVDDVRYLTTLHKAIDDARAEGDPVLDQAADDAETWLADLKITDDVQQVREEAIAHILNLMIVPAFLPGDANGDGVVSADDYASVQANFGNSGVFGILGDANLDGLVSADDYASVQANFGNTAGAGLLGDGETSVSSLLQTAEPLDSMSQDYNVAAANLLYYRGNERRSAGILNKGFTFGSAIPAVKISAPPSALELPKISRRKDPNETDNFLVPTKMPTNYRAIKKTMLDDDDDPFDLLSLSQLELPFGSVV